jgi:hypothetical protein
MGLRSALYALAFLLGGAFLFIFAGFCAISFLVDSHCGSSFGYDGCEIPRETGGLHARPSTVPGDKDQASGNAG